MSENRLWLLVLLMKNVLFAQCCFSIQLENRPDGNIFKVAMPRYFKSFFCCQKWLLNWRKISTEIIVFYPRLTMRRITNDNSKKWPIFFFRIFILTWEHSIDYWSKELFLPYTYAYQVLAGAIDGRSTFNRIFLSIQEFQ